MPRLISLPPQLRRLVAPENAAQAELAAQAEREALAGTPPPHSPLPMQSEGEGEVAAGQA